MLHIVFIWRNGSKIDTLESNCWICLGFFVWFLADFATFIIRLNSILGQKLTDRLDNCNDSYPPTIKSLRYSKLCSKILVAVCQFLPWVNFDRRDLCSSACPFTHLKSGSKKGPKFTNWPFVKNLHFLPDPHETWWK